MRGMMMVVLGLAACGTVSGGTNSLSQITPKITWNLPPAAYLVHQNGRCLTVVKQKLQLSVCNGRENQQFNLGSDKAWVIRHQCLAMVNRQVVTQPCQLPTAHGFGLGNRRFMHHQSELCAQSQGKQIVWRKCEADNAAQNFELY